MVSSLDVAVTICEDPEESEVYSHMVGSEEYDLDVLDSAMIGRLDLEF